MKNFPLLTPTLLMDKCYVGIRIFFPEAIIAIKGNALTSTEMIPLDVALFDDY